MVDARLEIPVDLSLILYGVEFNCHIGRLMFMHDGQNRLEIEGIAIQDRQLPVVSSRFVTVHDFWVHPGVLGPEFAL